MKAALVTKAGAAPVYADFAEPAAIDDGFVRVAVAASALSHVTKSRASGRHYSAGKTLPFVPGIDGTGTLDDGTRVYFVMPEAPYGGMAEYCVVKRRHCIALPATLDAVTGAAIAIPGMSSWAALVERARLVKGETVLINGATGVSGRLAVQIAKHLGAAKVIATGRNEAALESLRALGADVTIHLSQDAGHEAELSGKFEHQFEQGIGVVLDYLWGPSAERLLLAGAKAAPDAVPLRFVQIGAMSGGDITLPSAVLRSSPIELKGSGIGSVAMPRMLAAIEALLNAATPASLAIANRAVPLSQVAEHWAGGDSSERIVFTTGRES